MDKIEYRDNRSNEHRQFNSNTPCIIDVQALEQFGGFKNPRQLESRLLLENYLNHGFIARGLLLKSLVKTLNEINRERKFIFEDEEIILDDANLDAFHYRYYSYYQYYFSFHFIISPLFFHSHSS